MEAFCSSLRKLSGKMTHVLACYLSHIENSSALVRRIVHPFQHDIVQAESIWGGSVDDENVGNGDGGGVG